MFNKLSGYPFIPARLTYKIQHQKNRLSEQNWHNILSLWHPEYLTASEAQVLSIQTRHRAIGFTCLEKQYCFRDWTIAERRCRLDVEVLEWWSFVDKHGCTHIDSRCGSTDMTAWDYHWLLARNSLCQGKSFILLKTPEKQDLGLSVLSWWRVPPHNRNIRKSL